MRRSASTEPALATKEKSTQYLPIIMASPDSHANASPEDPERLPAVSDGALHLALQLFDDETHIQTRDDLENYVLENVVALLTKNPERLMSILYRIDVPEHRVRQVMSNEPVGGIARMLTALLLERMEQKLETRRKYKEEQMQKRSDGREENCE